MSLPAAGHPINGAQGLLASLSNEEPHLARWRLHNTQGEDDGLSPQEALLAFYRLDVIVADLLVIMRDPAFVQMHVITSSE